MAPCYRDCAQTGIIAADQPAGSTSDLMMWERSTYSASASLRIASRSMFRVARPDVNVPFGWYFDSCFGHWKRMSFRATTATFRTSWFVESLLTELVIAMVMRTQRPFFRSRPGTLLLASTVGLTALSFAIPYVPFAGVFGFVPLPGAVLVAVAGITTLYVVTTEVAKKWFYRSTSTMVGHAVAVV